MNLKQIKHDFDNKIIVSRETIVKLVDYAIELEGCLKERINMWDDETLYGSDYDIAANKNEERMRELLKE